MVNESDVARSCRALFLDHGCDVDTNYGQQEKDEPLMLEVKDVHGQKCALFFYGDEVHSFWGELKLEPGEDVQGFAVRVFGFISGILREQWETVRREGTRHFNCSGNG